MFSVPLCSSLDLFSNVSSQYQHSVLFLNINIQYCHLLLLFPVFCFLFLFFFFFSFHFSPSVHVTYISYIKVWKNRTVILETKGIKLYRSSQSLIVKKITIQVGVSAVINVKNKTKQNLNGLLQFCHQHLGRYNPFATSIQPYPSQPNLSRRTHLLIKTVSIGPSHMECPTGL